MQTDVFLAIPKINFELSQTLHFLLALSIDAGGITAIENQSDHKPVM
jgi:hypothetical protein